MTQENINTPKYFKVEEHRVETHAEATALADTLFEGFKTDSHRPGDRTAEEAKVRIRSRHASGDSKYSMGDFRVILYRAIASTTESAVTTDTDADDSDATNDDTHSQKQSKAQRKKATKEAAHSRGKQSSSHRKTHSTTT